jgi:hypothetical protein
MALARSPRVKEQNIGRTDGPDQARYLNPTTQTTCVLRGPGSAGFPVAIF